MSKEKKIFVDVRELTLAELRSLDKAILGKGLDEDVIIIQDKDINQLRVETRASLAEVRARLNTMQHAAATAAYAQIKYRVPSAPTTPPAAAEWLLGLFVQSDIRDALLGDLEERFCSDRRRFGIEFARRRYLIAALRSTGPLLLSRVKRLGLIVMIYKAGRWLFG